MKYLNGFPGLLSALAVLSSGQAQALTFSDFPLSDSLGSSSMVMMTLGRDHTLAFEAYNDSQDIYNASYLSQLPTGKQFSDLTEDEQVALISKPDGIVDNRYIPDPNFKYYGYFENNKCYTYTGSTAWNPTSYSASDKLFTPAGTTANKKCPGQWSGDFLNYLTMTRIDILRKALYGGWRDTDTATDTILQRAYIPQDTHAFGKEYTSLAVDGYLISDYTPLSQPVTGTRHLFSSVSLAQGSNTSAPKPPSLQVLNDSQFRIWDWVSIEKPIAGQVCLNGEKGISCIVSGGSKQALSQVGTQADFDNNWNNYRLSSVTAPTVIGANGIEFSAADDNYFLQVSGYLDLSSFISSGLDLMLDGVDDSAELYINGQLTSRVYDGYISGHGLLNCAGTDGTSLVTSRGTTVNDGQLAIDRCYSKLMFNQPANSVTVTADKVEAKFSAFTDASRVPFTIRYLENTGGDSFKLMYKNTPTTKAVFPKANIYNDSKAQGQVSVLKHINQPPASGMVSYVVRVKACTTANDAYGCAKYGSNYKPEGLLQQYDKKDSMLFGLLTGSYTKNLEGGVLRKNVGRFNDEFDAANGTFKAVDGVVKTLNAIRVSQLATSNNKNPNFPMYYDCYEKDFGFTPDGSKFKPGIPSGTGKCSDWGNPIAEMMYETLRYLQGHQSTVGDPALALSEFNVTATELHGSLPKPPDWGNPFKDNGITDSSCVQPYQIVVSDINPSYDFDTLPGASNSGAAGNLKGYLPNGSAAPDLNVGTLGKTLWDDELGGTKNVFIGHSDTATYNSSEKGAPSAKSANSFATIHGPWREGFHQGSYHSGSVAYYGQANKVANYAAGAAQAQTVKTMAVVMSSPVPQIDIPISSLDLTKTISLIPFARTVGGQTHGAFDVDQNNEPSNQVADFYYTEPLRNKDPNDPSKGMLGQFVVGYENMQQGADYDMDMRLTYNVETFPDPTHTGGGSLRISMNADGSSYTNSDGRVLPPGAAFGTLIQHAGLVISGAADTVKGKDGNDYKVNGPWLFVRDCDSLSGNATGNCVQPPNSYHDRSGHPLYMSTQVGSPGAFNNTSLFQPLTWTLTIDYPATSNSANIFLKDPLWYAAKWGNFDDTNNNQKPDLTSEWDKINNDTQKAGADGVPDGYFYAKNPGLLPNQLSKAFESIKPTIGNERSGGGVAVSNGLYDVALPNLIYSSSFKNDSVVGWYGDVKAEKLTLIPASGSTPEYFQATQQWSASTQLANRNLSSNPRKIWTAKIDGSSWTPTTFEPTNLGTNQRTSLGASTSLVTKTMDFLKGLATDEGTLFRNRTESSGVRRILGDVIDSPVLYVGKPVQITTEPGYSSFQTTYASRAPMVYVGANDGMLHAFDALTGDEKFAFVPTPVMHKMRYLADKTYGHKFFVNGQMVAIDANFGSTSSPDWKTVLVGGYGSGAKGIFALDITDPSSSNFGKPLWEFTDAAVNYDATDGRSFGANLGHNFAQVSVAKLATGDWGVLFGNGYNSTNGVASLYILKLSDGSVLERLDTNTSIIDNGLSSVTAVDFGTFDTVANKYTSARDGQVDMVFAGDLKGNVWQFDLSSASTGSWSVVDNDSAAAGNNPVFTATSPSTGTPAQPITSQIMVSQLDSERVQLTFGTGQYLETADKTSSNIQSLYSVRALVNPGAKTKVSRSNLFKVNIYSVTNPSATPSLETLRVVEKAGTAVNTKNAGSMLWDDINGYQGWYIDLVADSKNVSSNWNSRNERMVTDPELSVEAPVVEFITQRPSGSSCGSSNAGAVLRPCLFDGTSACAQGKAILDTNKDNIIDDNDLLSGGGVAIGGEHDAELNKGASLIAGGSNNGKGLAHAEFKDGTGKGVPLNWSTPLLGRQSWRNVQ